MDIDTESIIKLIFPNSVPDAWKDNPDFYAYLAKLGNYNVEQLNKEPDHLNSEKVAIQNQTQELAFANYKTFIRTAECSREIFKEFRKTEERVDSLLSRLPELSGRCEEWARACEEVRGRRRWSSLMLTRHSELVQLLEVPQLMEGLIRHSAYDQALALAAYVRRLAASQPTIPVIQRLGEDIERLWWVIVERVSKELGSETQLPGCLQLAGHLRRMGVLSEPELRLKFLQARRSSLSNTLASLPPSEGSQHLSKTIELTRTHVFNIVTQYKAAFAEEEAGQRPRMTEVPLLHAWLNDKVVELVTSVEADVEGGIGPGLDSVLGQCMYLGQSLGRVGADARAPLAPVFLSSLRSSLVRSLTAPGSAFSKDLARFSLSTTPATSHTHPPSQPLSPPSCLVEFYPLSNLCNAVLGVFNELRLCAPLCLAQPTTQHLQALLVSASNDILQLYRREQQAMSVEERDWLGRLCSCFADQLVPYLQRCLHHIYSPIEIASFLGVPSSALQAQGLTYLDMTAIAAPINHLLPPKLETITTPIVSEA